MKRSAFLSLGLSVLFAFSAATGADSAPGAEAETLMCQRGKLLLSDSFDQPLDKPWRVLKGKWEVSGEAVQGSELKADNHGAVIRANLPLHNAVIEYSFKLDGAKTTTFSINDATGHNSRVIINAAGFTVKKDDHDHMGPDQPVVLQAVKTRIGQGEWHTIVIELNGPEFLTRLDGKQVAYGSHAAIDVDKANIGLTVAGESVSFRNLRVWEATEKANWPATRATLAQSESAR